MAYIPSMQSERPKARLQRDMTHIYIPIIILLTIRLASPSLVLLAYAGLAIFALFGRRQAIYALALSWFFTMVSPAIAGGGVLNELGQVTSGGGGGIGRYFVIIAAAISAFMRSCAMRRHPHAQKFTLATLMLGVILIVHSILISPLPDVSILKAASWTISAATLISLWLGLSVTDFKSAERDIFVGLGLLLILSLPLAVLPQGYLRNGTGFQGLLNHPQAFGPTMAFFCAWAGARMFGERRPTFAVIGLTGISLIAIILSEARTAALSAIFALALSLILSPFFAGRNLIKMAPGLRSSRIWTLLIMCMFAGFAFYTSFSELITRFLSKSNRTNSGGLFDAYEASRGSLIDTMLSNIAHNPFWGIGFGIASDPSEMVVERDPLLGLPVGAAIEKGVAPIAIMEEVGVFITFLIGVWVFWLLRKGSVGGLAPFAVFLTGLLLNLGENTLFSPGGQGMLTLVLLGWVYASGMNRRNHA